jgi:hypothetical protein
MPPPALTVAIPSRTAAVRIAMLKSAAPVTLR